MNEKDRLHEIIKMIIDLSSNNNLVSKKIIEEISVFFSNGISEEIYIIEKQIESNKERISELNSANQYLRKSNEPQPVPNRLY